MTELKKKEILVHFPGTETVVQRRHNIEEEDGSVGQFHSFDGEPAYTCYFKNGDVMREMYYNQGELHRVDGPASISYIEQEEAGGEPIVRTQNYYWNGKCIDEQIENGEIALEDDGSIPEHAQFTLALSEES